MNFYKDYFCILILCITPIVLDAVDIDKLAALHRQREQSYCPSNTPISSRSSSPTKNVSQTCSPQNIKNYSDIVAKQIVAKALDNQIQARAEHYDIDKATAFVHPGIAKIMKAERAQALLKRQESNKPISTFCSIPPHLKRDINDQLKTNKLIASIEIEKIKEKRNATILKIEKISDYKFKAFTGAALTATAASLLVAQKNIPQHRIVGVDDALIIQFVSSVVTAIIPMVTVGCLIWKVESWIRSGDQAKIKAIKIEHSREIQEVLKTMERNKAEIQKAIDKEIADRIKSNQNIKRECLDNITATTHELTRKVNDFESKVNNLSGHLEATQNAIVNANHKMSEMAPNVATALQNSHELKSFIATQIFPSIKSIESQITTMQEREENYIDPLLADNIEHVVAQDAAKNYPAGTPLTSGGHASTAIFNRTKKQTRISGFTHTITAGLSAATSNLSNPFATNNKKEKL